MQRLLCGGREGERANSGKDGEARGPGPLPGLNGKNEGGQQEEEGGGREGGRKGGRADLPWDVFGAPDLKKRVRQRKRGEGVA
jgi:hypothetical protein